MNLELKYFKTDNFYAALQRFFKDLKIPFDTISKEPARPQDILEEKYKEDHPAHQLMEDIYFLGMVDDDAFEGNTGLAPEKIKSDYDGILIFGVTLNQRENGLLPTRSQLAEITRSFNRAYCYTPVLVVFKYENDNKSYIAFANAERLKYKQARHEDEKAGKVSLLRDINLDNPHSGHLRILSELTISRSGKKAIKSFADLYVYWQTVFNVSLLNKKFYEELSNWYFWAIKEVTFPSQPTLNDIIKETGKKDNQRLEDSIHEHNAKNVIRLLTRFLFVWFIKEKNLIPEELFDLEYLKNEILNDFSPYHIESKGTLFEILHADTSNYYKAILQNLFFASLNCPIVPLDKGDTRKRRFKKNEYYGQDRDANFLLRYEDQFKQSEKFLELLNKNVPFLNGGLFECLDNKTEKIYIDGFSDNLVKPHKLVVPDYLFFGFDEEVDLSTIIGIKNKKTERAKVKGLINIFASYKFTIAENTPIEEDIALDPELLGKVFENLLASYNPETKTTARKQTGSFYTPREIVNYMVDESLIAYLKNAVKEWNIPEEEQDSKLHQLLSFDPVNPFVDNQSLQKEIIKTLGHCTILDPACGSGAFPMGVLQKMVHILQKVDPDNESWKELQLNKAIEESEHAFLEIKDKHARQRQLDEINETFDEQINDPDYARKLFLIENCIYGVDIQPIAVQISKLRFFISLVVDQKVDKEKNSENFGIRPLPNLETKFVAANTLIGIEKSEKQGNFFVNPEIDELEKNLKTVRHRIFSAKTPRTKRKLRDEDQRLRKQMGELLVADGWLSKSAGQLAGWDPYDQNASSAFFDSEWMFGVKDGFDVVIGNPPYVQIQKFSGQQCQKEWEAQNYRTYVKTGDIYSLFYEQGNRILKNRGHLCFITSNKWMRAKYGIVTREFFLNETTIKQLIDFGDSPIFEAATTYTNILIFAKGASETEPKVWDLSRVYKKELFLDKMIEHCAPSDAIFSTESFLIMPKHLINIKNQIEAVGVPLKEWNISINYGIKTGFNEAFIISREKRDELIAADPKSAEILKPVLRGKDIKR
ncbi:Eco57I restriction-modification methylase domain-containing protein, partial [bacterium]|nr:Eco57I restriction-modification methylase domain-containing protein [bacterium]